MAERLERELFEGKVYYFSNGTVSPSNRKYSTIDNDYKVNFSENKSEVKEAEVQVCLRTQFAVSVVGTMSSIHHVGLLGLFILQMW